MNVWCRNLYAIGDTGFMASIYPNDLHANLLRSPNVIKYIIANKYSVFWLHTHAL